jgi:WD40 repeat protein
MMVFEERKENGFRPAIISPNGTRLAIQRQKPSSVELWDLTARPPKGISRLLLTEAYKPAVEFPSVIGFRDQHTLLLETGTEGKRDLRLVSCKDDILVAKGVAVEEARWIDNYIGVKFFDLGKRCIAPIRDEGPCILDSSGDQWKVVQKLRPNLQFLHGAASMADGKSLYLNSNMDLSIWDRTGDIWGPRTPRGDVQSPRANIAKFLSDGTLIVGVGNSLHAFATDGLSHPTHVGKITLESDKWRAQYLFPHPTEREFLALTFQPESSVSMIRCTETGLEQTARVAFGDEHRKAAWCAAYSPDGDKIAIGFWDASIRLYERGDETLELAATWERMTMSNHVCVLAFSPDSEQLACGDFGGFLQVYSLLPSGPRRLARVTKHNEAVRHAFFTRDGQEIISGSQGGEIRRTVLEGPATDGLLQFPD